MSFVQLQGLRLHGKNRGLAALPKKINSENSALEGSVEDEEVVVKKKTPRTPRRTRKKATSDNESSDEETVISASSEESKKPRGRTRKKGIIPTFAHLVLLHECLSCMC